MKQSLQSLIDQRKTIPCEVIRNITYFFAENQKVDVKKKIKYVLENKFYTFFDDKDFTRKIFIENNDIYFSENETMNRKYVRDQIIKFHNGDNI